VCSSVVNHRDRGLVALDTVTNRANRLGTLPGDAPERIAFLAGSLWITGRGTDLLRVDSADGAVRATVEIGASGIDLVAAGGALWIPVRSAATERRGFPTMSALRDVHGLVADGRGILLADNTKGALYRLPG